MKKRSMFLPAIAAAVCVLAFAHGQTSAFFSDRDTETGSGVGAGYLDVRIDADLSGYGVPGDILDLGTVRITNNSPVDIVYKLCLTADIKTTELLDTDKGTIILKKDGVPLKTDLLRNAATGTITLEYYGELATTAQDFDLALAFKGLPLVDGNDYQNKPFSITHEVIAYQAGSGMFAGSGGGE